MRKKVLFILLGCLAVLLLALGSAVWWASSHMRTPEFRAELAQVVREATGRELLLEGELSISVFPWFGLKARGCSLGNDPAFGATPLLAAEQLSARIRVLPLLQRHLVFDTVELQQADLTLTMDDAGRGNWEGLAERLRQQENATDKADAFFRKVTVRAVRLVESKARLDDRQHKHSYIVTGLDLRTGRIESGKALPFTVTCDFTWPRPGLTAHLDGTGLLHWSADDPLPLFTETVVQGEIGGTFMPQSSPRAALSTTLTLEDGGRHLKLSDVKLRLLGSDVSGEVTFFDVTDMFRLEARLHLGRFSPRSVLNAYWPGTIAQEHQGALGAADGELELYANVDELIFASPSLHLDGAQLKGWARMGFDDVSGLDFDVAANHLDVDAYVAAFNSNSTGSPLLVSDLPLDYLRGIKGAGRLSSDLLKLAGVSGQGAEISWQANAGAHRAQLKPLKAQGGSATAELWASFDRVKAAAQAKPAAKPAVKSATAAVANPAGKGPAGAQPKHLAKASDQATARPPAQAAGKAPAATGGQPAPEGQPVLGWGGALRLDGVDARQVSWLNGPGCTTTGRLDLRARAEASRAPAAPGLRLGQVLRRATGEVSGSVGPGLLEWPADKAQGRAAPKTMHFSTLQGQARFVPVAAGEADWALQLDGGLNAVGTRPLLNLEAKVTGLLRGQQGKASLSGAVASGRLRGWFLPKRENEAGFSARGGLDLSAQALSLTSASVQACGLNLSSGALSGSRVLSGAFSLSGRVRCAEGDPKRVLAALDVRVPKASDKRVLQRLTGEADLTLDAKGATLANISAQLDDMPLRGSYAVQNFDAPRQTLSLGGGHFDLDRYLPAPEPPRRGGGPEPRPTPEALPVDTLRDLVLEGNLALRSFKYRGLTTRDFKATVSAKGGSLLVKPLGGNFYGGSITGEFSAQVQGQGGMQTRLAIAAKDFQAGPFMLAWAGKELVTGRTDLFLDVSGTGATDQEVLRSLEGLASFKITDGSYVLSGTAEAQPVQVSGRRTPPGATPQTPAPARRPGSPFAQASARLKVAQGVFRTEDFRMDGPSLVVTGKGQFTPVDDSIAVNLTARMSGVPDVPIKVFGRLKDPEMEIPTGALIGNAIMEILGLPLKPIKFFKDLLF